jgi:hypothetical protein
MLKNRSVCREGRKCIFAKSIVLEKKHESALELQDPSSLVKIRSKNLKNICNPYSFNIKE